MSGDKLLTHGSIFKTLLRFALPVMLSLFLQSLYGAVDLLVVGHFGSTSDVSGVATGSMLMHVITNFIAGLSMGVTVLVGQKLGEGRKDDADRAIGTGIFLFTVISLIITAVLVIKTDVFVSLLQAPKEAFSNTRDYVKICSWGFIFIVAYNLLGGIFRGLGDSETPLKTVIIAAVLNIFADILFVKYFHMGASGAAYATIISQAVSVIVSMIYIKRLNLPVSFKTSYIRLDKVITAREMKIGFPIAIQDLLVGVSFLVIQGVVNSISLVASAAIGVGEKVCAFIMLIPSAFAQSMTAFVAQNFGAGLHDRARKGLKYGVFTSLCFGAVMCVVTVFFGDLLSGIFTNEALVIAASHDYLKAYAIDCLFTPIMFCMIGYFNGYGRTSFVMLQGVLSAFLIRTPLSILFGRMENASLFLIGLSTPCSSFVQIICCLLMYGKMNREINLKLKGGLAD